MNTVAALLLLCLIPECSLEDDCPGTYQYVDACSSCSDGYGLLADPTTGCAECPSHCSNCEENSGSMACVQCSSQYGLNTDSGCQRKSLVEIVRRSGRFTCLFRVHSSGQEDCTLCQSYYALVNGQCQSADYCTAISISGGSFTCTACDSGFYATSGRCQGDRYTRVRALKI
ncbi:hypothetical protein CAPTEDRAFT_191636 [Capitella teleta]|uniref:TNFR-Cys domain-containing protein n=1 Tax=Capitella teleta TaxID=283909 RepID=R7UIY3_CAPTE|nr:hypothetical protein CAPTEDRAFT_191636 [Capitella teleta]|eukprot:ELU06514.1 hypothetical protein CAPTEDRAFT_191636 [Capitella teleta]